MVMVMENDQNYNPSQLTVTVEWALNKSTILIHKVDYFIKIIDMELHH